MYSLHYLMALKTLAAAEIKYLSSDLMTTCLVPRTFYGVCVIVLCLLRILFQKSVSFRKSSKSAIFSWWEAVSTEWLKICLATKQPISYFATVRFISILSAHKLSLVLKTSTALQNLKWFERRERKSSLSFTSTFFHLIIWTALGLCISGISAMSTLVSNLHFRGCLWRCVSGLPWCAHQGLAELGKLNSSPVYQASC